MATLASAKAKLGKQFNRKIEVVYSCGMIQPVGPKLQPLEIEEPPPQDPLYARIWASVPKINWWFPVQLANTGWQKALSYLPYGMPDLIKEGYSYETLLAVQNLNRRGSLTASRTLCIWMNHVMRTCRKEIVWIEEPSISNGLANLQKLVFKKLLGHCVSFVSIPTVFQGLFENHIVHILVQLPGKRPPLLEYFDPFGFEPEQDAKTVWDAVKSYYDGKCETYLHTTTLQVDRHNCGVAAGWHFFQRVVSDVEPDKIASLKPNFEAFRHEMIQCILNERPAQPRTE